MSNPFDKVTGPRCPRCECQDSSVRASGTRWGQATTRRVCNLCGMEWTAVTPNASRPLLTLRNPKRKIDVRNI